MTTLSNWITNVGIDKRRLEVRSAHPMRVHYPISQDQIQYFNGIALQRKDEISVR